MSRWAVTIETAQGRYFLITGAWPLVHFRSFLWVTGPKRDVWLVKTVGVLMAVNGAVRAVAGFRGRVSPESALLGAGAALGLAGIDVWYVARRVIPPIYLLDAGAEVAVLTLWTWAYLSGGPQA
jgi:hypothetical protein